MAQKKVLAPARQLILGSDQGDWRGVFNRIFAPTEKLAPTGKVGT
jgi:hypothetical protein